MKVVILAGGFGTRFGKLTDYLPKPMIPIGPMPILWHLIRYYESFGFDEFIIATGYKSELIKEFFANLRIYSNDFTAEYENANTTIRMHAGSGGLKAKVTVAYTGQDTMTGGRVKRVEKYLEADPAFMLTYGDGLTDLNLHDLADFHRKHGKCATLTAVHPPAKFGNLQMDGNCVTSFAEKEGRQGGIVNGGFYVFNREIFNYIPDDKNSILERGPFENLSRNGELHAYTHLGYWQCMDTTRDLDGLQESWNRGNAPWKRWSDGYTD